MSSLKGHLLPPRTTAVFQPSPSRRPPLTPQSDWTLREIRKQRLFERHLFLHTTTFKIVARVAKGGPAELLRMIFHYGNIRYESMQICDVDLKSLITKTPHGNLPVLWLDHNVYGETNAIARHLASHLGLLGKNDDERLIVEATLVQVEEIRDSHFIQLAFEELAQGRMDDSAEHLMEVMLPKNFGFWETQIQSTPGNFLLASGLSVADMAVFDFLEQHMGCLPLQPCLENFPSLNNLYHSVPQHPRLSIHFNGSRPKKQGEPIKIKKDDCDFSLPTNSNSESIFDLPHL